MPETQADIHFFQMKEILGKELGSPDMYEFLQDREETVFRFQSSSNEKPLLFDAIGIIRQHLENFRIYTWEEGYLSIQALNENIFDPPKNLSQKLKIRFLSKQNLRVEISKVGGYSPKEIQLCIALFHFFRWEGKEGVDPTSILLSLGVDVYQPQLEETKGNRLDFSHLYGYASVKDQILESLVYPLQNPQPFLALTKLTRSQESYNLPRAVLFEGEPGVGKTSMAKIAAHLCQVPLVYVPIESILSKYYGVSSQNLAQVFDQAALFPRCLLFLDEIDSLATSRDDGLFEATRNVLSVLLRKMDGFSGKTGTITIGATNRKKDLDSALLSRFDRKIFFPLPNQEERTKILEGYAKHLSDAERGQIAEKLEGTSGRNLKDFCDFIERTWVVRHWNSKSSIEPPTLPFYLANLPEFGWNR